VKIKVFISEDREMHSRAGRVDTLLTRAEETLASVSPRLTLMAGPPFRNGCSGYPPGRPSATEKTLY
jgi:hypothetical protein